MTSEPNDPITSDGAPQLQVAHSWELGLAPFGLDRPIPLLGGGTRLLPHGIASSVGAEHLPDFRSCLAQACRGQALSGRNWYHHPPMALVGEEGSGRGIAARWLARAAGLPLVRLTHPGCWWSTDHDAWPSQATLPPTPVAAIAATRCANPVVLVEFGGEHADDADLAAWINPDRASRWLDEKSGGIFDISQVNWIVQAQALSESLEHALHEFGHVLHADRSASSLMTLRSISIALEACGADEDSLALAADTFDEVEALRSSAPPHSAEAGCAELCRAAAVFASTRRTHPTASPPPFDQRRGE